VPRHFAGVVARRSHRPCVLGRRGTLPSSCRRYPASARADGDLYSPGHRNLLLYRIHEVMEHGRTSGLMAEVPDPFGRAGPSASSATPMKTRSARPSRRR